MRRPLSAAALTAVAMAFSIGLSATAAQAATRTWTVSPGGAITGTAGTTTLEDNTASQTVTCTSSTATGSLKTGTDLKGKGIGTVTSLAFNNCTVDGVTLTVSTGTVAFPLNAKSYASGLTKGSVSHIHFSVSSSICSFVVDGTSGTADNGSLVTRYRNSNHTLRVIPQGSTLHIYDVSGCFSLINNNDAVSVSASYKVSPKEKITSP